jgi:hypothetical protein
MCPHEPQLFASVDVAVQAPGSVAVAPQTTSVATMQLGPQVPALHAIPVAHAWPQAPQFCGSLAVAAQTPAPIVAPGQSTSPVGHVQTPETHVAPVSQTLPQPPQLLMSVEVSTQPPFEGQFVRFAWHTQAVTAGVPEV